MLRNNYQSSVISHQSSAKRKQIVLCSLLTVICSLFAGCRYDMQDQPRYEYYEKSDFFANELASRRLVEGTVPRGYLRADKALYTGKKDTATAASTPQPQQTPATGGQGAGAQATQTTYPDAIDEFPLPVTKELIDRGEERYKVFCIVCHGPNGEGNGMVVRRGFTQPPSYQTEQLRNAPVGHFYDVISNGWGRMNGYASMIPVQDRWAIVAYIRAIQAANPNLQGAPTPAASPQAQPNTRTQVETKQNGGRN
jgi:mono/diheme cytochrome c family protein